ncbi:TPA: hypothetical protein P2R03_004623 [Aeromonas veronii]|nr:hypothetical protein [Aeromonas veronii]
MKKSLLLLAMLAAIQAQAAPAQEGVWQVSKGKPFPGYNYRVEDNSGKEEVSLTLTCDPSATAELIATVGYTQYGHYGDKAFGLIIDGKRYDGIRRLGEDFPAFWEALRAAKQLAIFTEDEEEQGIVPVPTTGLAAALPAVGSSGYFCRAKEKPESEKPQPAKGIWRSSGDASKGYTYSVQAETGYKALSITCAPGKPVEMSLALGLDNFGTNPLRNNFDLMVDGKQFDARASLENDFNTLWDALRNAKQLAIYRRDGQHVPLPTEGIASTLPALGSSGFPCLTAAQHNAAVLDDDQANIEQLKDGDVHLRKRINPYYRKTTWNKYLLDITSRSNRMVITDLKINRGSCTIDPKAKLPFRMGFGGKVTLSLLPEDCNPLEVTVTTLGGEQTLSFDQ